VLLVRLYLPKKQHQTLYEALEIVVLGNSSISIQRDVTEYLRATEKGQPKRRDRHYKFVSPNVLLLNNKRSNKDR